MFLAYSGCEWDQKAYTPGDKESWGVDKMGLGLEFPNLPYFIDGDLKMTETNAIMKYIAAKHGPQLLGTDPVQIARVEMLAGVIGDLKGAVTMPCYTSGDRAATTETILTRVQPIVAFLGEKQFLAGDNVTYVDFTMFELCQLMDFISEGQLFTQQPSLQQYCERVKSLPKLAEFYADDEKCMKRPFNNKIAKINN